MIVNNCRKLSAVLGLGLGLNIAAAARADDSSAPASDNVTSYQFDDDSVHGELYQPLGEVLRVRARAERGSLIRVRTEFIAELLKSAERL